MNATSAHPCQLRARTHTTPYTRTLEASAWRPEIPLKRRPPRQGRLACSFIQPYTHSRADVSRDHHRKTRYKHNDVTYAHRAPCAVSALHRSRRPDLTGVPWDVSCLDLCLGLQRRSWPSTSAQLILHLGPVSSWTSPPRPKPLLIQTQLWSDRTHTSTHKHACSPQTHVSKHAPSRSRPGSRRRPGRLELPSRGQPSAQDDAPVNAQTQSKCCEVICCKGADT
jgi:hypothetical protein